MILIVDDNYLMSAMIEEMCKSINVQFKIVQTGEQALAICAEIPFGLVFMDLHLEGAMCGIEAAIAIHRLPAPNGQVPIIALTGLLPVKAASRWDEAKFVDAIVKPFSVVEFTRLVQLYNRPSNGPYPAV